MVRTFRLINEKDEEFSLMDIDNFCLLTEPDGLGYSYESIYEKLGNIFIETARTISQGKISGQVNFINYDNFQKFVQFIETAKKLKFSYKIPINNEMVEYFKDINIESLGKTQKNTNGIITEPISFDCLSLWYQDAKTIFDIGEQDILWDFVWEPRFADYKSRSIVFENDGHVEAPIQVELCDYLKNPSINVLHDGKLIYQLALSITIQNGEKLLYSSKEKELYIRKQNIDGSYTNLFTHDYIDLNNTNIFRLPKGTNEITLTAENNIVNAKLNIFKQYKVV